MTLLALLDLSMAFHVINHSTLMSHQLAPGLRGTILWWFKYYLGVQSQKIVLGGFLHCPMVVDLWGSTGMHLISHQEVRTVMSPIRK